MIVLSLLLVLGSLGLLIGGVLTSSLRLDVGSIVATLLAALALYLGVRQRRAALPAAEEPPVGQSPDPDARDAPGGSGLGGTDQAGEDDYPPPDEPAEEAVTAADAASVGRRQDEVEVVDGRPRYHLAGCGHLIGRETVRLPIGEAREAGFTPCGLCRPDATVLSRVGPLPADTAAGRHDSRGTGG